MMVSTTASNNIKDQKSTSEMQVDKTPAEVQKTAVADIKLAAGMVAKGVNNNEKRFITRVVRGVNALKKRLNGEIVCLAMQGLVSKSSGVRKNVEGIFGFKSEEMEVDKNEQSIPEVEYYFGLLALVNLIESKRLEDAANFVNILVGNLQKTDRRSLDQIAAKIYFYYGRIFELKDSGEEIRGTLLKALRTATLKKDEETQAVALNSLLRNYLHFNLYDQASKLVEKTAFPTKADNNQFVRYLYYVGRIKAIELEYTQSHSHLSQAIRKAPQSPNTAGFLQAANKLSIIVQLLMGEIPERSLFRQKLVSKSLIPYLHLTRAVRVGDLAAFQDVLQKYMNTFKNDKTYTLILRLRHNVIKTAVRMISLSYSRISLKDVAQKLLLNSEEDAEFIVAKTIRDGVIDASIDHIGRFMKSKENVDVYSTNEPQLAFHQRIAFCLSSYNDSVKAMRFPDNEHKKKLEDVLELEREQEKELKDIEDMDEDYEME